MVIKIVKCILICTVITILLSLPATLFSWIEGGDTPLPFLPFNYNAPWITDESPKLTYEYPFLIGDVSINPLSSDQLLVLRDVAIMYLESRIAVYESSINRYSDPFYNYIDSSGNPINTKEQITNLKSEITKLKDMLNVLNH